MKYIQLENGQDLKRQLYRRGYVDVECSASPTIKEIQIENMMSYDTYILENAK